VLGHIQRGGETSPADRILSLRYAVGAAELIERREFGQMVNIRNGKIGSVSLEEVICEDVEARQVKVKADDYLINVAKHMGISFGVDI